jgi:hypothetical protein
MKKLKFAFMLAIVTMILVACGRPTADSSVQPTLSPLPTAPVSPISPLPVPPLKTGAEEQPFSELRAQVADQIGLPATALILVFNEQVTWPDTSLGCPQPDMMYAQVLTPGWRVVFEDAEGQVYQVHTDEDFEYFIICAQPGLMPPRSDS